ACGNDANSQHFYPRWGMMTIDGMVPLQATTPAADFEKALLFGWSPEEDLSSTSEWPAPNSAARTCRQIWGQQTVYYSFCEDLLLVQAALALVPGPPTPANLALGMSRLGNSFTDPYTLGPSDLGQDRSDGVAAYRL